jgi:hypothetical protein
MASSSSSRPTIADPPSLNFFPKDASLHGVEFAAQCPPDVSPKTRIIAVCGITDIGGSASPAWDGWFLSDFWMFNHLFRSAPVANQIWLTCCSPKQLVERYGRYAHGNPFQERRVVLEERLLETIRGAGTLRVVEPKTLLERFIKTVEDECKEAIKAEQSVLLLIFGHGDSRSYGVTIGSNSNTEFRELSAPRLTINRLKIAVGKAQCTLLMTSCYSGGWAVNPDLNSTVIAAAGPKAKSQSWNASLAQGFSRSIVASAIRDAIFASEIEDEKNLGKPGMTYQELQTTETYAEMGCLVHDHLKQSDRFHDLHRISFASQDDEWTKAWRERTGIPLAFFKAKWEELSILPTQEDAYSNRDPSSAFGGSLAQSLSDIRLGSTIPLRPTKTMPQIYTMVRALAAGYANSFPGPDNVSINTAFHSRVRELLSGANRYENRMDDLLTLGYTLSYRLEGMAMATDYKNLLGLEYPDCTACIVEAWTYPLYESKEKEAKHKLLKFEKIKDMIQDAAIFSAAADGQGYDYDKPEEYLAIALVESNRTREEVEEAIGVLKDCKSPYYINYVPQLTMGQTIPLC